jgi:uncharacterized iron-regulated membrane protein
MNWLHTWAGVVLGGLLFAIFWTGTLSVFDREIDRWMMPMTRLAIPASTPISIDSLRPFQEIAAAAKSQNWNVQFPTERTPAARVSWRDGSDFVQRFIDPATGTALPDPGTWAGTRFLYPFHYMLHLRFERIGYWIVGLAAMVMMALCVSGVVIHRKIFADFFTFRVTRKPRRLVLDLHNVTGVLGLPFHFLISLSGLVILFSTYFPSAWQVAYNGDRQAFFADAYGTIRPPSVGQPGGMASLDAMAAEARRLWDGAPLRYVTVRNPGDATSVVQIGRLDEGIVSSTYDAAYFDGPTGKLISYRWGTPPVMSIQRFISGLHFIQFRHWTLRWVYFALGLAGCVMIATGYLFWLESRRKKHAQLGLSGVRFVEGLTIGSVTGIVIATLSFFVVNRLLPLGATFLGEDRVALEIWTFYLVWLATFAHAWRRPGRAWIEQCWMVAAFAVAAVALNWITTGDHLARSLAHRHLWAVGGMDVLLLAGAAVAGLTALKLRRRQATRAAVPALGGEKQHA